MVMKVAMASPVGTEAEGLVVFSSSKVQPE